MTEQEIVTLVQGYKKDFHRKTGRHVKIIEVTKYEEMAAFCDKADFDRLVEVVCEYTDWDKEETFAFNRKTEYVLRRAMIFFIAVENNVTLMDCGKKTGRDHTTVIHAVKTYLSVLETDHYHRKLFGEVMEYVRNHYFMKFDDE